MYISKWWYDFIGGTDDSLTLLAYIKSTEKIDYNFGELLKDFHINSSVIEFYRGSPNVFYISDDGVEHNIYYAINLIQDLSVIVLESYKNGNVKLSDLTNEDDEKVFKIFCSKADLNLIINILIDFAKSPLSYKVAEMIDENDMLEIASQCAEIAEELKQYS